MKLLAKSLCLTVIMGFSGLAAAMAHEIWATAENPAEGQPLVVILGYGDDFPQGEEIAPDRLPIFNPLKVVDAKGAELALKPGDANFKAVTKQPVKKGTYLVLADYRPTYWSERPEGSVMKPKNEVPGATACGRYSRAAKGIVNIGGVLDDFVTKPIGAKLEIVPLLNPGQIKAGQNLPLQVLYNSKPLPSAQITGIRGGNKYVDEGNRDFFAETDKDGKIIMAPLTGGDWTLAVSVKEEYPNKSVCDNESNDASLTFFIAD